MSRTLQIDVVNRQRGYRVDRARLAKLARAVLAGEAVAAAEVEIAVVDDVQIARLNEQYLGHRGATDVLSFDLSDASGGAVCGQVIVSADTARRRAAQFGHTVAAELALYVMHGLLHLLGYDDQAEPQRTSMHARQRELAMRLGVRLKG